MRRTLVLLVLAAGVAGLLWLRGRQTEELADPGTVAYQYPLFANLVAENVVELGVENLERAVELRLVRGDGGDWRMVDPIEARAFPAMVQALLDELERGVGRPAADLDAVEAGLEPPRAVLSFVEETPDGPRRGRIEVGAPDVEKRFVHARVPGHPAARPGEDAALLRASRSLETYLDRGRDDYRDPLLLAPGGGVARIVRSGSVLLEGRTAPIDLGLELERDGQGGWRVVAPTRMAADPDVAGTLLRAVERLEAERFLANVASDAARFELDRATFRFELERLDGTRDTVLVKRRDADPDVPFERSRWVAGVEGEDVVAEVLPRGLRPALLDLETFYDQQLVRAQRKDVRQVELRRGGRTVVVQRVGGGAGSAGDWVVHAGEGSHTYPASHGLVEDLLSAFERATVASFPPMVGFPEGDVPRSFVVRTLGGVEFSGAIGAPWRDAELGAEGLAFQRTGDALPGIVSAELAPWFEKDVDDLRRRVLWKVPEGLARRVELERGDRRLVYRKDGNEWFPDGADPAAKVVPGAFYELLEQLLGARATAWLDEPVATEDTTVVRLVLEDGEHRLLVGRFGDRVVGTLADDAAVELEPRWLELLDALLR